MCYFLLFPAAAWLSNGLSTLRHATSSTSPVFFFWGTCEKEEIQEIVAAVRHEWHRQPVQNVTGTLKPNWPTGSGVGLEDASSLSVCYEGFSASGSS